tara:strand:- start:332 stop:484 length:153 start_codon:yes stop_codon:yes gene_type:complete
MFIQKLGKLIDIGSYSLNGIAPGKRRANLAKGMDEDGEGEIGRGSQIYGM